MNIDFDAITQVIGCAYTFQGSLGMRKYLTKDLQAHHSSQNQDFSYFYKGNKSTVVRHKGALILTRHPITNLPVKHWPEPELAMMLGKNHEVTGYCLGNDFTAFEIELLGRSKEFDGTFFGKCWKGSASLGPKMVPASEIDLDALEIGLRIERGNAVIYDSKFSVKNRKREFNELPGLIVDCRKRLADVPPSKNIAFNENGLLTNGTVIMTGTGLIVPPRCYSQKGDIITVYSQQIGELRNVVKA